jgi:hypothetical protein
LDPDLLRPVVIPQPDLNQRHFLPLSQHNTNHVLINVVSNQRIPQKLPNNIKQFFLFLFAVPELNQETTTVKPFFPKGLTVFVKECNLGVVGQLRWFFDREKILKKLLKRCDFSDEDLIGLVVG